MRLRPYVLALLAGSATWSTAEVFGVGPLRAQAPALGALAGLFVLGLHLVRFRAPPPGPRDAALRPSTRVVFFLVLGGWLAYGGTLATRQLLLGYETLGPDELFRAPPRDGFRAAEGAPVLDAVYSLQGSEGRRFVTPLDGFDGRLLLVTERRPEPGRVRVTGRLRDDLRAVIDRPDGSPEAFLPRYRARVGLPDDAPVRFLDTSVRAGLDVRTLLHVATPLYLGLLLLGVPIRRG